MVRSQSLIMKSSLKAEGTEAEGVTFKIFFPFFLKKKGRSLSIQSQSRTRDCTSLTNRMICFGTGQYRRTVSGLPLFFIFINIYKYIYIYIYVCVCIYIIINIRVYHKTLPQFKTNYSQFQTLASIKRKKKIESLIVHYILRKQIILIS